MKIQVSIGLMSLITAMGFGSAASLAEPALPSLPPGVERIQYDRYPDQRRDNAYQDQRRDDQRRDDQRRDNDQDFRGAKWRPGQVLPGQFLNRVVADWEERGLSRPPDGHQWVRVGQQFVLVRGRDRMIARILNFD